MSKPSVTAVIARKEFSDALKSKVFVTFFSLLLLLTVVSITVASFEYKNKVQVYNQALQQIRNSGQIVPHLTQPDFYPLQLLRPAIEYLEITGAVLAIVLGYATIAKEKGTNTFQLLLTRPISRAQIFFGKFLGNVLIVVSVTTAIFGITYLALVLIAQAPLSAVEATKVVLTFFFSTMYLMIFFSLSAGLALAVRSLPNALILSFVLWLLFVLIIPQIGDTLDPDNQVPGGFFAGLQMNKAQSDIVLKGFSWYEVTRNAVEEMSITKHFERLSFALTGIKDTYNGKPVGIILHDKRFDVFWITVFLLAMTAWSERLFSTKQVLWKETT